MKKVLFVCLIAASFTACNSGTATETKIDSPTVKVDAPVVAPAVIDSTKKDSSSMMKMDSTKKMTSKKDSTKKM